MDVRIVAGGPNARQFIVDLEVQWRSFWSPLHVIVGAVGGEEEHEPVSGKSRSPGQLELFAWSNHGALARSNQLGELMVWLCGGQQSPTSHVCGAIGDVPDAQDVGFRIDKREAQISATRVATGVGVRNTQCAAFVGREKSRHVHAFPIGRLAHNGDGLRAEVESPVLPIDTEESIGGGVLKRHKDLLGVQARDGVAGHLIARCDARDGALWWSVLFTECVAAGTFNARFQGVGLHQGVKHERLSSGRGVTIAHDGARPHSRAVGAATLC